MQLSDTGWIFQLTPGTLLDSLDSGHLWEGKNNREVSSISDSNWTEWSAILSQGFSNVSISKPEKPEVQG